MTPPPVTDLEGIQAALEKWYAVAPDGSLVVLLDPMELGMLHYVLAEYQQIIEEAGCDPGPFDELYGSIRHKVEHTLSQAGYGGDPRP